MYPLSLNVLSLIKHLSVALRLKEFSRFLTTSYPAAFQLLYTLSDILLSLICEGQISGALKDKRLLLIVSSYDLFPLSTHARSNLIVQTLRLSLDLSNLCLQEPFDSLELGLSCLGSSFGSSFVEDINTSDSFDVPD